MSWRDEDEPGVGQVWLTPIKESSQDCGQVSCIAAEEHLILFRSTALRQALL